MGSAGGPCSWRAGAFPTPQAVFLHCVLGKVWASACPSAALPSTPSHCPEHFNLEANIIFFCSAADPRLCAV